MEDRSTARSLKGLADLYKAQGKFEKAEPFYRQALSIWEKVLGLEYAEPAGVLENYADLLRKMNREEEAALLETRAIEIPNSVGS
jgi:tetratricopeptide (TPR) repeat protein